MKVKHFAIFAMAVMADQQQSWITNMVKYISYHLIQRGDGLQALILQYFQNANNF